MQTEHHDPDYYLLLGIRSDASAATIKAAFKRLALRYHPDIYHGADAEEQMRQLLLAYRTLSDPRARRAYDARRVTAHPERTERQPENSAQPAEGPLAQSGGSRRFRRDRTRPYAFPTLRGDTPVQFTLGEVTYDLSPQEARTLQQGCLYGGVRAAAPALPPDLRPTTPHQCHRCHHSWMPVEGGPRRVRLWELICPACKANDWGIYVLLRCVHCQAVFESEQIREQFGPAAGKLFTPYELFPLCPCCGAARWCPVEEVRLEALRRGPVRGTGVPRSRP
jgi:hypothetical protein